MKKALFITLLLLSINVAAQTNSKIVEIKKKAIYYELKLKIEIGKIEKKGKNNRRVNIHLAI